MKPIIVLGMHRSGTSAVTRAIGLLGAEMGDARRMRKHWENLPLRKVNEHLIGLGNGSWDAPPKPGWWDTGRARKQLAVGRATVEKQFGAEAVAVWKDPRTCLTLPFWLEVFDEDPVFLLIHRHPTEVADSLTTRNRLGRGHGYAIWERYNADALRYAEGRPTVVLDYDTLVTDPVSSLAKVCEAFADFGVPLPKDPATTDHGLVAQERHHTAESASSIDGAIATPSQRELFDLLRDVNGTHAQLTLPRPVPDPSPLSLELFDLVRRVRAANKERNKARQANDPGGDADEGDTDEFVDVPDAGETTGLDPALAAPAASARPRNAQKAAARKAARKAAGGAEPLPATAPSAVDVAERRARRVERRKNIERRASRRAAADEESASATTTASSASGS